MLLGFQTDNEWHSLGSKEAAFQAALSTTAQHP